MPGHVFFDRSKGRGSFTMTDNESSIKPGSRVIKLFQITKEELETLVSTHNPQTPASFAHLNLCGMKIPAGSDLTNASFKGALCYDLDLESCVLTGCDFSDALHLDTVIFHECVMDVSACLKLESMDVSFPHSVKVVDEAGNKMDLLEWQEQGNPGNVMKMRRKKVIVRDEAIWILDNPRTGCKPNFRNSDISGLDVFEGRDLSGISFAYSDCYMTSFKGCILTDCDFSNAEGLDRCNFGSATMDRETYGTLTKLGAKLPESVMIIDETKAG
jgi:uncharacterized protein YjbI with pentapeptide repeats